MPKLFRIRPRILLSICLILFCLITPAAGSHHSYNIPSNGLVNYSLIVVKVDYGNRTGINVLTLGTQVNRWAEFPYKSELKSRAKQCRFGLFRIFVGEGDFKVCTSWDEDTKTGTYQWNEFDDMIRAIKEIGAEPMVCICGANWLPSGMSVNPDSEEGYPLYPEDFAKYCADIVRHCNIEKRWGIKYWEIWNEPLWHDAESITEFVPIFNVAQAEMHKVDPNILCGNDRSNLHWWLDEFVRGEQGGQRAEGMGFLSFHKYDSGRTTEHNPPPDSDAEIISWASNLTRFGYSGKMAYPPSEIQQTWLEERGELLPVVCSETNMNWAWWGGTDPRIQQMLGAVWYAEELRAFILDGATEHSVYFVLASTYPGAAIGKGFGMMQSDGPHELWYPYCTNFLIGNNLAVGDEFFETVSSSTLKVTSLAWKRETNYEIMLIGKTNASVSVSVSVDGIKAPETVTVQKIEGRGIEGNIQQESMTFDYPLIINLGGYSVTLLTI